ncbi:hypothetical protein OAD13_04410 [Candidatus Pelagibacter sp.]|nr:hypothetical protein [Candidatus Pelagibacter sp.]
MDKIKNIKISKIEIKIIQGKFGNGKYYGYGKNKLISLVKFKTNNSIYGYGESLVGIYSPKLFEINVKYLSSFFINKTLEEAINEIDKIQNNKFFFYQGLLKSVLSAFEIALLSIKSKANSCSLGETINQTYFNTNFIKNTNVEVYASAGSIKSNFKDLKEDVSKSIKMGINRIKIRLDTSSNYKKKINFLEKEIDFFAVDLIANTFIKNRDQVNLIKFLKFIKQKKILWVEEALNVDDLNYFTHLNKFKKIPFSYGENFTSFIDFSNLFKIKNINYVNLDITHCTISDLKKLINHMKVNKIKKKIIFHCWGSLININTSLEIASILSRYVYMVELPITDFSLNNFYVESLKIKNSKLKMKNRLEEIEKFYDKIKIKNKLENNKFSFD